MDLVRHPLDVAAVRHQSSGDVVETILDALRGVRYGQVTVNVQQGEVVQIDRMERHRFKK